MADAPPRRYALVGTGARAAEMYLGPIAERYGDVARVVGVFDANPLRARLVAERFGRPPVFDGFEAMLEASRPDAVIVTSQDSTHDAYIVGALRAGCDVITEKPMTIDEERCRAIVAAHRETGHDVRVTFNYRFVPVFTEVKRLLASGTIGRVLSVDFHWYLDTHHGADYFRRWHRRMENSGGLFVHKATHHFDLVNWWLGDRPAEVSASGSLRFYGPSRAERGVRCSGCEFAGTCEFHLDLAAHEDLSRLYVAAESADGYHRDGCVFDPEIDISDTMAAIVRYEGGATMSYSLNAYCAEEGVRAAFNGTTGRLEVEVMESRDVPADEVRVQRFLAAEPEMVIAVPRVAEGHGGADDRLLDDLFRGAADDPLGHAAGVMDGAYSVLTGVAANRSMATGGWVRIDDLLGAFAA
jgi:predicted dehydrogenase